MVYLLDTHAYLWFLEGSAELSGKVKNIIEDTSHTKYVSLVSFWEISLKLSLQKLEISIPYQELMAQAILNGFEVMPLTFQHTQSIINLPFFHKDPFDRMLIGQAVTENITILSRDEKFSLYPISVVW